MGIGHSRVSKLHSSCIRESDPRSFLVVSFEVSPMLWQPLSSKEGSIVTAVAQVPAAAVRMYGDLAPFINARLAVIYIQRFRAL